MKVQIHAVISCHTKWTPSSLHFVVIFWLPPAFCHGPGLLMMALQKKLKIKRYWCILSMAGWSVWHEGAASVATLATHARYNVSERGNGWPALLSKEHELLQHSIRQKKRTAIYFIATAWHAIIYLNARSLISGRLGEVALVREYQHEIVYNLRATLVRACGVCQNSCRWKSQHV